MPVRAKYETTATATSMPWIPLNVHEDNNPVSFQITYGGTGDRTSHLDWTLDNVLQPGVSAVSVAAFMAVAATAGSLTGPFTAVRLRTSVGSGANTVALRVLQGGI